MFFWRKERQVEQAVEAYVAESEACASAFREAIEAMLSEGLGERFDRLLEVVCGHEHACDVRRRQIESEMYDQALIPESRGDVMGLLEALDLVPNQCESVLHQLWTEDLVVGEPFRAAFAELVEANLQAAGELAGTVRALFADVRRVVERAGRVSELEERSDGIERGLIRSVFESDMPTAEKLLLRDAALAVGDISDRAENAADRLRIIAVKRRS